MEDLQQGKDPVILHTPWIHRLNLIDYQLSTINSDNKTCQNFTKLEF